MITKRRKRKFNTTFFSPSNLKVVGALENYSIVFVIFINFFGQLTDRVGQVFFLVSCPKGQVEKYVNVEVRGKRFTVCTKIVIILGTVRFTIRGGRLRYKRYNAKFFRKKSSVELPFSSFGDHF
jgi:hypothetical protein